MIKYFCDSCKKEMTMLQYKNSKKSYKDRKEVLCDVCRIRNERHSQIAIDCNKHNLYYY